MFERVLGPSTDPAALRQERPQPARADRHPRLLRQIPRQPLGRPHVKGQAQRRGRRLQRGVHRRQISCIGSYRPAAAGRIRQRHDPPVRKACQPVLHGFDRAPAPARDALHRVTQRRRFDHLQPLAHAPRQVRAPQLRFNARTLLGRDDQRRARGFRFVSIHLRAPLPLCLLVGVLTGHLAQPPADRVPLNLPAHT